jgi:hypothetical protein
MCERNYGRKSTWQWIQFLEYPLVSAVLLGRGELIFTRLLNESTLKRKTYRETQTCSAETHLSIYLRIYYVLQICGKLFKYFVIPFV